MLIRETPFIYGRIATDENFIDREVETTNLVWNFVSLSNTIIISPRGWGKSSLVNKAAKLVTHFSLRLGLELLGKENCIGFHPILSDCKRHRFVK